MICPHCGADDRPPTLAEVIGPERFRALVLAEREQAERIARRRAQMRRAKRRRRK